MPVRFIKKEKIIAFRFKLSLLAIATLNAAVFHWHFYPYFKRWRKTNLVNIFSAISRLSLIIWTGIMIVDAE